MNENKIEFSKVIAKQEGYPEVTCRIVKANVNRKDELKDKFLCVVPNIDITESIIAVTPNITEALGRVERKTIGVINDNGDVLVPMNNASVVVINNKYIACNEYNPNNKMDPTKFQETITSSQEIKDQMRTLVPNLEFKCDNYNSKYNLYKINEDNTLEKVFEGASYIAVCGDTVYVHTNDTIDETVVFGEKKEETYMNTNDFEQAPISISGTKIITDEPQVQMPVSAFATIQSKPIDNLEATSEFTAVNPGAPALIEKNDDVAPVEENVPSNLPIEEKPTEENSVEETPLEVPIKENIMTEKVEVENTIEKTEKKEEPVEENKSTETKEQMADIAGLVSAVKNKINNNEKKIEEQEEQLIDKNKEIEELKAQIENLKKENISKTEELENLTNKNITLTSKVDKLERSIEGIYSEFSGMLDETESKSYYKAA